VFELALECATRLLTRHEQGVGVVAGTAKARGLHQWIARIEGLQRDLHGEFSKSNDKSIADNDGRGAPKAQRPGAVKQPGPSNEERAWATLSAVPNRVEPLARA
jgi:hypothetical protein